MGSSLSLLLTHARTGRGDSDARCDQAGGGSSSGQARGHQEEEETAVSLAAAKIQRINTLDAWGAGYTHSQQHTRRTTLKQCIIKRVAARKMVLPQPADMLALRKQYCSSCCCSSRRTGARHRS